MDVGYWEVVKELVKGYMPVLLLSCSWVGRQDFCWCLCVLVVPVWVTEFSSAAAFLRRKQLSQL